MTAIAAHTTWMTGRQLRAIARQPGYVVIMLIQPVIWLFLFGSLFRSVVELPGFGCSSRAVVWRCSPRRPPPCPC
jgi:ABC-2 type transport system permease protein